MKIKASLTRARKEHSIIRHCEPTKPSSEVGVAIHSFVKSADKGYLKYFFGILHDLVDCHVASVAYSARAPRNDVLYRLLQLSLESFGGQVRRCAGTFLILACVFWATPAQALKIDRVILSTNNSHDYIQFWPLIAKVWKEKMGIQPTLALIGDDDVQVDTSLGDVVRFKPIPGVPTWFYAQIVRLLFPAYYPNDICMISDIDMLPLNRNYFEQSMEFITDPAALVIFRDKSAPDRYPMCYIVGRGATFQELFNLENLDQIPNRVAEWFKLGLDWYTDETVLYRAITNWSKYHTHVAKLGYGDEQETDRICRSKWQYDLDRLRSGGYVDAHLPRPYCKHVAEIEQLARDAGLLDGDVNL